MTEYERLSSALKDIRKITDFVPQAALVLGSGLGGFAESGIDIKEIVEYKQIEGFPVSTAPGHKGRFIFGYVGNVPIVAMQGRIHFYEGYTMPQVVMPIRLMKLLGAETLFLTNAAGGINRSFTRGDLMMFTDHISCFVPSPLIGKNIDELGRRFFDMTFAYDRDLQTLMRESAKKCGVDLKEGVYAQLTGPGFETPAEIKMLEKMGADAVGMSTVCETLAARHMCMRVCAVSCITNMAAGVTEAAISHTEVMETTGKIAKTFETLMKSAISNL